MNTEGTPIDSLFSNKPERKKIECTRCGEFFYTDKPLCPKCEQPVYISTDEMPELIKKRARAGKDAPHAFGWEVEVEFSRASQKPNATFHWRGCTYRQAYRNGMFKPNAARIVSVMPVTEDQWKRCYGIGRM